MGGLRDECGIIGINQPHNKETALLAFLGLYGLQHRGQEGAGIAVSNDGTISCYKEAGLVNKVIDDKVLALLKGEMCLGHVLYSNSQERLSLATQPLVVNYKQGTLTITINGGLKNGEELRNEMAEKGVLFSTDSDCEVIAALIARYNQGDMVEAIKTVMNEIKGGYALGIMTETQLIGVRDPLAIRPLCIGKIDGGYVLASESCAIDMVDGEFLRDVRPGEIIIIENGELTSIDTQPEGQKRASCIFEYVYFSRPDSEVDGVNVYQCRERAGLILAKESPVEGDIVMGVPDSGTPAAIGFAAGSGISYSAALVKNKYVGRTFIQPTQLQREMSVKIKLNPIKSIVAGKRVILVDDSIVRGTTMKNLIATIKAAGATEVHLRISSPPVFGSCYFGVDTPDKRHLIANSHTVKEMEEELGADSLGFISIEGLIESVDGKTENYCTGCFNEVYPIN